MKWRFFHRPPPVEPQLEALAQGLYRLNQRVDELERERIGFELARDTLLRRVHAATKKLVATPQAADELDAALYRRKTG